MELVTKADIVSSIRIESKLPRRVIVPIVEAILEVIKQSVARGHHLILKDLGSFSLRHRVAQPARNVYKGTWVDVPAHNRIYFRPIRELRIDV